jgi:hypothetical protein
MYELAKLSYVLNFHDYYHQVSFFKDPNNYILMITFIINVSLTQCVNHAKLGEQTGEC